MRHPLFLFFLVMLLVGVALLWSPAGPGHAVLLGFNIAALAFIGASCLSMRGTSIDELRKSAARNDANRSLLLGMVALLLLVVLVSIGVELGQKTGSGLIEVLLVVFTLALAWGFGNLVCALHYTHMYYDARPGGGDHKGLAFPGPDEPDFWDFCYFAFVLGMTFQVSDVQIESRRIRRVATVHSLLAFFFNIGVVAMTVNVVATALSPPRSEDRADLVLRPGQLHALVGLDERSFDQDRMLRHGVENL